MPRRTNQPRYDPQSMDSQFATLLSELKATREALDGKLTTHGNRLTEIHVEVKKTNGRVTSLESWRTSSRGWVLGVSAAVGTIASLGAAILKAVVTKGE